MLLWKQIHPKAHFDMLGFLPELISDYDSRPAKEQFNINYAHGGGWRNQPGFTMNKNGSLQYPGDPPSRVLFETKLRDEVIRLYEHEYVVILQPDGSFEACRMD